MPKIKNILQGKRNKTSGALFERRILSFNATGLGYVQQIPDGCKMVSAFKMIRVRTPFDFIYCYDGRVCVFDTKNTVDDVFGRTHFKQHQMDALKKFSTEGIRAGLLVNFQSQNLIVFYDIDTLIRLPRGIRLKSSDGILIGQALSFDLRRVFNGTETKQSRELQKVAS